MSLPPLPTSNQLINRAFRISRVCFGVRVYARKSPRLNILSSAEVDQRMDFDHNNKKPVVEDRLSSLPDELIHKILYCFDMKFVVQTCLLSSRWEFLWKSMPCLNFSSWQFRHLPEFAKFVTNVLSRRNHQTEVSSIKLDFHGAASQAPPTKAMKQKEARAQKKAKLAADIESDMKEFQALLEHGNLIVDQKEKAKAAFENIIAIFSKNIRIRSLLEKLPKRERAEIEARFSRHLEEAKAQRGSLLSEIVSSEEICAFEKLMSDYMSASSSSSTSVPTPSSTSSINPMP
ncbi:hypothetical protein L2E82_41996 [Cichorium intybus]|uniref:Uncharacterized protein n=1 Tax=Cichorium intybus TaxID=13427 RepID=A0ACB8ZLR5_CICIN|nr:hypothetical protein L2E82_41996 [Cichorium intybus]